MEFAAIFLTNMDKRKTTALLVTEWHKRWSIRCKLTNHNSLEKRLNHLNCLMFSCTLSFAFSLLCIYIQTVLRSNTQQLIHPTRSIPCVSCLFLVCSFVSNIPFIAICNASHCIGIVNNSAVLTSKRFLHKATYKSMQHTEAVV